MDYQTMYAQKLRTAEDAVKIVQPDLFLPAGAGRGAGETQRGAS